MFDNPFFGFVLTYLVYQICIKINKKFPNPFTNPLLLATILCSLFLIAIDVSFDSYMNGAKYITYFIAPATVSLMYSLYMNIETLKKNFFPIIVGIICGSITSMLVSLTMAKLLGFDKELITTILPQSITMPLANSLSSEYRGIVSITTICVALRGNFGAALAKFILKTFKIKDPVAQGVAMGTTSHASGTSEARKIGEIQGAMSGLSIAIAGLVTVILMPLFILIVNLLF